MIPGIRPITSAQRRPMLPADDPWACTTRPESAASLLARWAIRWGDDTVLEPSFGGCTILEAAVKRLRSLGCAAPADQLFGFDIDLSAFGHLRRVLGHSSRALRAKRLPQSRAGRNSEVSTVIGNPPFVSYHRMNAVQRKGILGYGEARTAPSLR